MRMVQGGGLMLIWKEGVVSVVSLEGLEICTGQLCCIRCGLDEERILDVVPR